MENNVIEELINLVRDKPNLWNHRLKSYKDVTLRSKSWVEIASAIPGIDAAGCKAKWKCLRDQFNREHATQKKRKSGDPARKRKPWPWFTAMTFIKDTEEVVEGREGNLPEPKPKAIEGEESSLAEPETTALEGRVVTLDSEGTAWIDIPEDPEEDLEEEILSEFLGGAQSVIASSSKGLKEKSRDAVGTRGRTPVDKTKRDAIQLDRVAKIREAAAKAKEEKSKRRKTEDCSDALLVQALNRVTKEDDAEELFLRSFAPKLRSYDPKIRAKVKLNITTLFTRADLGEEF